MKFDVSDRKINQLEISGKKAKIFLTNGMEIIGIPDCICWLSSEENEDSDEEVLKFDVINSSPIFLSEREIKSFEYIN